MSGRFPFRVSIPATVYLLDRDACGHLLSALDGFGPDCGDACGRLRDDLRKALAVDAALGAGGGAAPEAEAVPEDGPVDGAVPELGGDARCACCGEIGAELPMGPGEPEPLYVCRTTGCQRNGSAAARKFFTTGYR